MISIYFLSFNVLYLRALKAYIYPWNYLLLFVMFEC